MNPGDESVSYSSPIPPAFRMEPIFYTLSQCGLTKTQLKELAILKLTYLKNCAEEERKLYDGMIEAIDKLERKD